MGICQVLACEPPRHASCALVPAPCWGLHASRGCRLHVGTTSGSCGCTLHVGAGGPGRLLRALPRAANLPAPGLRQGPVAAAGKEAGGRRAGCVDCAPGGTAQRGLLKGRAGLRQSARSSADLAPLTTHPLTTHHWPRRWCSRSLLASSRATTWCHRSSTRRPARARCLQPSTHASA